jgi:hypothetical protein
MMRLLLAGLALAEEGVGTTGGPASTPPVAHVTVDPLLPQAYRVVPPGVYPCEVDIDVAARGVVTDIRPVRCDEDARVALATAVLSWSFDPATRDGVAVDGTLRYATVFEVRSALPRKHVVGFLGASASVGGAGLAGVEARVHLGESVSATVGVDWDQDAMEGTGRRVAVDGTLRYATVFEVRSAETSAWRRCSRIRTRWMTSGPSCVRWGRRSSRGCARR